MAPKFQIGDWLVQTQLNQLSGSCGEIHVEPKVMQVLDLLARHQGSVLSKESILSWVWPDTFVTDAVLWHCIWELRRIFGDNKKPAGSACAYAVGPAAAVVSPGGANVTVNVSSSLAACSWTAAGNPSWIKFPGSTGGTGSGSLNISVDPNSVTSIRTGTITVAGQTITITQAAAGCH